MAKKSTKKQATNPFNNYTDITKYGPMTGKQLQVLDPNFRENTDATLLDMSWQDPSFHGGNVVKTSDTPSDYGMSKYDLGIGSSDSVNYYQNHRGEEQPWYLQLGAGLLKAGTTALTTFLDSTVGLVAGIGSSISQGSLRGMYDNGFSRTMSEWDEWAERNIPNYKTDAEKERPWYMNMGTANFWADQIKQAGFTIGSIAASEFTFGLGRLGKLGAAKRLAKLGLGDVLGLGKNSGSIIARGARAVEEANRMKRNSSIFSLGNASFAAFGEARTEARNNVDDRNETEREKLNQAYDQIIDEKYKGARDQAYQDFEKNRLIYGDDAAFAKYQETMNNIDSLSKTDKASKEQNENYRNTLNKIQEDSVTMGNWEMGLNLLLLTASNMIQFGSVLGNGFKSGRILLNARKHVEEGLLKSRLRDIGAIIKNPLTEGLEEMNQSWIAGFSAKEANSITDYHKALLDPKARQKTDSIFTNALNAFKETYGDIDNYAEFFGGAFMGATGVPMVRGVKKRKGRRQNSIERGESETESNWQFPITMEGGIRAAWKEHKAKKQREKQLIDYIDNRVKDPKVRDYYQGLVRHNKFQQDMDDALASGNLYDYKNAENNQLFTDIAMFDNVGELEDFKKNVESFNNVKTKEDAEDLVRQTVSVDTENNTLQGPFAQYATLKADGSIEVNLSDSQVKEVQDTINKRTTKLLNSIDRYKKNKEEIDAEISLSLRGEDNPEVRVSDEELSELMYLRGCEQNYQQRYDDIMSKNMATLKSVYASHAHDDKDPLYKLATAVSDEEFKKEFLKVIATQGRASYLYARDKDGNIDPNKQQKIKDFENRYNDLIAIKSALDSNKILPQAVSNPVMQQQIEQDLKDEEVATQNHVAEQQVIDTQKSKISDLRKQARKATGKKKDALNKQIQAEQQTLNDAKARQKTHSKTLKKIARRKQKYLNQANQEYLANKDTLDKELRKESLGVLRATIDPALDSSTSGNIQGVLEDLQKLAAAKKQYAAKFREFLYNATTKTQEEKEAEQQENDQSDEEQDELEKVLSEAKSLIEFRKLLRANEDKIKDSNALYDLLDILEAKGDPLESIVKNYRETEAVRGEIESILEQQGLSPEELERAKRLWNHYIEHYVNNYATIKNASRGTSSFKTKYDNFFDKDFPNDTQAAYNAAVQAQNSILDAIDEYEKSKNSSAPTGTSNNPSNPNGTTSTAPNAGAIQVGPEAYNDLPAVTEPEVSNNEPQPTNNNKPGNQTSSKHDYLMNAYPELRKSGSGYITTKEAINQNPNLSEAEKAIGTAVYDFLEANGAYEYVNDGNLKAGDTVEFIVDRALEEQLEQLAKDHNGTYTGPTILQAVKKPDGKYQYIGVLHKNTDYNNNRWTGLKELSDAVAEGYKNTSKGNYVHPVPSSAQKVYRGHFLTDNQERTLDFNDPLFKGKVPNFGIVKNDKLTAINSSDQSLLRNTDYAGRDGRVYALIDDGTSKLSPIPLRITKLEDIINDPNNPITQAIVEATERLVNSDFSKAEFDKWKKAISEFVYFPSDLSVSLRNNAKEVGISFTTDGSYLTDSKVESVTAKHRQHSGETIEYKRGADGKIEVSYDPGNWEQNSKDEVKDLLLDLLVENTNFNLNSKHFQDEDWVEKAFEGGMFNTNVNKQGVADNFFSLDPIVNGERQKTSPAQGSKNNPFSTPDGSFSKVTIDSNNYDVKTDNQGKVIEVQDSEGNKINVSPAVKTRMEWAIYCNDAFGGLVESPERGLYHNKYFRYNSSTNAYTVFDRTTNDFLSGSAAATAVKEFQEFENKKKQIHPSQTQIIDNITDNQKRVNPHKSDDPYYYIDFEGNGTFIPVNRTHSAMTPGFKSPFDEVTRGHTTYESVEEEVREHIRDYMNASSAIKKKEALDAIKTICRERQKAGRVTEKELEEHLKNLEEKINSYNPPSGTIEETEDQRENRIYETVKNCLYSDKNVSTSTGSVVDNVCRKIFAGETVQKPANISQKAFDSLVKGVTQWKNYYEQKGYTLLSNNVILYDEQHNLAGEVDLLAIGPNGEIEIIDFKTSKYKVWEADGKTLSNSYTHANATNQNISTYEQHNQQLTGYAVMAEKQYHPSSIMTRVLPINLEYFDQNSGHKTSEVAGINVEHSVTLPHDNGVILNKLDQTFTQQRQQQQNQQQQSRQQEQQNRQQEQKKPAESTSRNNNNSNKSAFTTVKQGMYNTKEELLKDIASTVSSNPAYITFDGSNLNDKSKLEGLTPTNTIKIMGVEYSVYPALAKIKQLSDDCIFVPLVNSNGNISYMPIKEDTIPAASHATMSDFVTAGNSIIFESSLQDLKDKYADQTSTPIAPASQKSESTPSSRPRERQRRHGNASQRGKNRSVTASASTVWNQKEEMEWLDRVLPQLSREQKVQVVKGLINVTDKGTKAWGQFIDGMIKISDQAAKGTVYHEAFHVVFNTLLNDSERIGLLEEARKKFGTTSDLDTEERLAEAFREFVEQGGKDTRSFGRRVMDFFKNLLLKITHWNKLSPSMGYYFKQINNAKYANKPVKTYNGVHNREAAEEYLNKEVFRKEAESFMAKFGISIKDVEESPNGEELFDALNKVIYVTKESDITDSVGYAIAFMMQHSPQIKEVVSMKLKGSSKLALKGIRRALRNRGEFDTDTNAKFWEGLDKDALLREVGKEITQELKNLYKLGYDEHRTNPMLSKIMEVIKEFLSKLSPVMRTRLGVITHNMKSIANAVKLQDDSLIKGANRKPGTQEVAKRVDVAAALRENPYEDNIIKILQNYNVAIAGSTSIALFGTLYRPSENPLHGLDFQANGHTRKSLDAMMEREFPNHAHVRTIDNDGKPTETYLVLDRPFYIETREDGITYVIDKSTNDDIGHFPQKSSNIVLNDGIKGKFLDFFTGKSDFTNKSVTINGRDYLVSDCRNALGAKINWARSKDIWDYVRYIPNENIDTLNRQKEREAKELKAKLQGARVIWGHPAIGKTTYLQRNHDILEWDEEINPKRDAFIREQIDPNHTMDIKSQEYKNLKQEYMRDYNNPIYRKFLKDEWDALIDRAKRENKKVFASPLPLLDMFPNSFDLVVATPNQVFKERNMQRGGTELGSRSWKQAIDDVLVKQDASKVFYTDDYFSDFIRHNLGVQWGTLTEEELSALQSTGWTEEEFNDLTPVEKEKALECMGF
jgi:hypothetical protein